MKKETNQLSADEQQVRLHVQDHQNGRIALIEAVSTQAIDTFAKENSAFIEATFEQYGAILFKNFLIEDHAAFYQFTQYLSANLMDYSERSSPRTQVSDKIYTSTEYPKEEYIPMHNENSYSNLWPMKLWFYCVTPATEGGETPIADSRRVYQLMDPAIKKKFTEKGLLYVRNYTDKIDLKWQDAFQTNDPKVVEAYCRKHAIDFEWKQDGGLRTKQVCQAVFTHPRTQETVWFNQAHIFHITRLNPFVKDYLLKTYGEENVPRNTYYGDGSRIEEAVLDEIRAVYKETQITFPWQKNDILMLDNVLYAHSRNPYVGDRKVLVSMADPYLNKHF